MQPLVQGKTKAYTFLLPILYGHEEAQILTNNFKDIDNVYIDADGTHMICVDTSKKAIFKLKFERSHSEWYELFTQGRYSKFGPLIKQKIDAFWNGHKLVHGILYKTQAARQYWEQQGHQPHKWSEHAEYWPKPQLQTEIIKNIQ